MTNITSTSIAAKKIRVIGVPLDLGQSRRGVDMGPSAVRVAGLEARLEEIGHSVEDAGNISAAIAEHDHVVAVERRLELHNPIDGRKRFRGRLLGLDGQDVTIDSQNQRLAIPFAQIAEAKLVLSDALIAEDLKARKRASSQQDAQTRAKTGINELLRE